MGPRRARVSLYISIYRSGFEIESDSVLKLKEETERPDAHERSVFNFEK